MSSLFIPNDLYFLEIEEQKRFLDDIRAEIMEAISVNASDMNECFITSQTHSRTRHIHLWNGKVQIGFSTYFISNYLDLDNSGKHIEKKKIQKKIKQDLVDKKTVIDFQTKRPPI